MLKILLPPILNLNLTLFTVFPIGTLVTTGVTEVQSEHFFCAEQEFHQSLFFTDFAVEIVFSNPAIGHKMIKAYSSVGARKS